MNIIETLNTEERKQISIKNLEKDAILYRENDKCETVGVVINGKVSIVTYLYNGNEVIYNVLGENEMFGNNLIFSSEPYYKGSIIAEQDSKIALISKDVLIKLLKTNDNFMLEYLRLQSNFGKSLNTRIKLLSIDSAEERFYFYMHQNKNKISYTSVSNLAKLLYMKRETLSRLLSKLEKQKKIKRTKNTIEVL